MTRVNEKRTAPRRVPDFWAAVTSHKFPDGAHVAKIPAEVLL